MENERVAQPAGVARGRATGAEHVAAARALAALELEPGQRLADTLAWVWHAEATDPERAERLKQLAAAGLRARLAAGCFDVVPARLLMRFPALRPFRAAVENWGKLDANGMLTIRFRAPLPPGVN